ncbi:MAG: efflux RND transporter periplasmic adaptor subunit [Gemmatimonadetes bacterium]|nr:efflux RND transporter periplasmic adaptor subunit [Gemmatimonadota bacterium]
MKRERRWLMLAGGAGLAAALAACGGGSQARDRAGNADTPGAAGTRVVNVEVAAVAKELFREQVRVTGTVQAQRDVTVAAEESGVVRGLHVEKGRVVTAGQPLVKIDDRLLGAQAQQAAAEAKLAAETYERQRRLWEEEKIGSELAYLKARYGAETAEASARVLATRLERTVVRAPIAGVLDARFIEIGSMVGPGTPVARIVDMDTVKVVAGVPERFAGQIRPGAETRIDFDVLGGREFHGRIAFVGGALDEQSRTFPIEVVVPNPGSVIKPGMVANVSVARRTLEAMVVPQDAVLRGEDGYFVYLAVARDGVLRAEARAVVVGASHSGRAAIGSGIEPGEQVVVVGQQQVAAGDLLKVVGGAKRRPE